LAQPGGIVWQIYDAQSSSLLLPEYHADASSKIVADTIPELAAKLLGIDEERFIATVREFNDSVDTSMPFQKDVKDGRCTHGLTPPKSNWARAIIEPPFEAYPCTTGITFTFGGVRIDEGARVLDVDGRVIRGLYTAGEMVGGLFYYNYPGGAGLTSAAVFGRIAGCSAATDT
jgi:tricarballylate dehydrogenase